MQLIRDIGIWLAVSIGPRTYSDISGTSCKAPTLKAYASFQWA